MLFGAPLGAWIVLRGPDSLRRPRELARLAAVFAVGLLAALRREGPSGVAAVTALGVGVYLVVFSALANLSFDNALLYGVIARFWQQPTVWICAWAGLGMAAVFEWIEGRVPAAARVAAPLCAPCAVALVALQIGTNYSSQDQHPNTVVADYGRGILASLPSNAPLISLGDLDTNSLRYLQLCEDVRPSA